MDQDFYLQDILSQGEELLQAISYYRSEPVRRDLKQLAELRAKTVVFSGMGSSHFCSFGADIELKRHGMTSTVISAGELLYYERGFLNGDTLLVLISQSGESAEIVHLLEALDQQVFVVALTNDPNSTLAKRADLQFLMHVSDEISVTTRTYISSLVMTQLIAGAICGADTDAFLQEVERVAVEMPRFLAHYTEYVADLRHFYKGAASLNLIGRGPSLSTVRAGALFLRETAKFAATDFDSAEFKHGPMELVDEAFWGVVFAPSGVTQELGIRLALSICEKGGRVLLVTDRRGIERGGTLGSGLYPFLLPETDECIAPLLQILPIQLMADAIAKDKGIPSGVFRWGSKICSAE